jgi:anti-sigma factor RsiW
MRECWSEGELRAYIDRELPVNEMERVAAHLPNCAECSRGYAELSARAARVSGLIGMLPAPEPEAWIRPLPVPVRAIRRPAAALGIAAALLLGIGLGIWRQDGRSIQRDPGVRPLSAGSVAPAVPDPPPAAVEPAVIRHVLPHRRPPARRQLASTDYFLALDDEPIETGVVVRVALGANEVKADVIVGSDGRAHAIRLINDK